VMWRNAVVVCWLYVYMSRFFLYRIEFGWVEVPSPLQSPTQPNSIQYEKWILYTYNQQTMTKFRHITNAIHNSLSNHYTTHTTPVDQTSLFTFFQVWTPEGGTHYCTPDYGRADAQNMLSQ
jgi:hypothetical protein